MRHRTAGGALALLLLPLIGVLGPSRPVTATGQGGECSIRVHGPDSAGAVVHLLMALGQAWGQVFTADDTLIHSITAWRFPPPDTNATPMHLYIMAVDSLGKPDGNTILQDGPSLSIPFGPTPGQPVEVRYEFDPPFALPARGKYCFAIQEGTCFSTFSLLGDTTNVYPEGAAWKFDRTFSCGICCPALFAPGDMIFQIEFCDLAVQTNSATWGRVKASYR